MGTFTAKDIVLIRFPFSDLSGTKVRPALVLTQTSHDDFIIAQITSQDYSDQNAIVICDQDLHGGKLLRKSYIRPGKIFTGNHLLIQSKLAVLKQAKFDLVIEHLIALFKS